MSLHWLDLLLPATWYCCTRTDEVSDTKTIRVVLVVCFSVYIEATSSSSSIASCAKPDEYYSEETTVLLSGLD
jgi:hypothetical protein